MAWEELAPGKRGVKDPTAQFKWRLSISKSGITLYFPTGHAFTKLLHIKTMIGKGEDEGWIRLEKCEPGQGRKVMEMKAWKTKRAIYGLRFSSLPWAPNKLTMTHLEVRECHNPDASLILTAIELKLPWDRETFAKNIAELAPHLAEKPRPALNPTSAGDVPSLKPTAVGSSRYPRFT